MLLWATIDMQPASDSAQWQTPEGKTVVWRSPEHCVVLTGYDADNYYCNDPLHGETVAYEKDQLEQAYRSMFSQAVVLSS